MADLAIQKIKDLVKERVHIPDEKIMVYRVITDFMKCSVYYIEYTDDDPNVDESDCFYYALIDETGNAILYDDGIYAIERLKVELDRRRGFWSRILDFTFMELVAAFIAFSVTVVFVYLSIKEGQEMPKEFIGIFGIIVGYYFGKNVNNK